MKRRLANGLEQDAIKARRLYAYTANNPALVAWVKRQINKRERREGRREAREGDE